MDSSYDIPPGLCGNTAKRRNHSFCVVCSDAIHGSETKSKKNVSY